MMIFRLTFVLFPDEDVKINRIHTVTRLKGKQQNCIRVCGVFQFRTGVKTLVRSSLSGKYLQLPLIYGHA